MNEGMNECMVLVRLSSAKSSPASQKENLENPLEAETSCLQAPTCSVARREITDPWGLPLCRLQWRTTWTGLRFLLLQAQASDGLGSEGHHRPMEQSLWDSPF